MQKDNDKGFALLEILGGLVVISLLMPLFWSYIEDYLNEMRNQSAAFHADAYNTAARTYIADNNARLHSGTLPATFTADELIRKGYLKGLNRSPFGQSYTTGIRRNTSTGRLEALTCSTGGENIKDDALRSIASLLPGLGGFIGKNGTATGVFGGCPRCQKRDARPEPSWLQWRAWPVQNSPARRKALPKGQGKHISGRPARCR